MSWKGFTKAMARLPQQLSAKAGYAETTVDPEFIDLEDKFKGLESCVRKLHEDARKFNEGLADMLTHQEKFVATLSDVFKPISTLKSGSTSQMDLVPFLISYARQKVIPMLRFKQLKSYYLS